MITKEQLDYFQFQYSEEITRYSELIKKGEIYLSIHSLLLTALLFNIKDIRGLLEESPCQELQFGLLCASLATILISIILDVCSLRIATHERPSNLRELLSDYNNLPMANTDFFTRRAVDFTVAMERNSAVNNKSANFLRGSLYFLAGGLILGFIFLTLIIKL